MCANEHLMSRLSNRHSDKQTSYAWSLWVKWQRWRSHRWIRNTRKLHGTRKSHGSICYRTGVKGDRSLHCRNRHFGPVLLLWPWSWPDDLHIRTWPAFPEDTSDVQIWTSYVKAFESYRPIDRQTDRQTYRIDRYYKVRRLGGAELIK